MSFTSIPDRRIRHLVMRIFKEVSAEERVWALLRGEMAWDGSVLPDYAQDWWTHKSLKHGGKTYVDAAINWVINKLNTRSILVDIDGPNAVIRVHAEENMSELDRLLVKVNCLRRAGIIYRAEKVGDAGPHGLHIPIFRVTMLGECEVPHGYTVNGLHRDVFLPGRLDVGKVCTLAQNGRYSVFTKYDKCRREYDDGTKVFVQTISIRARLTFRKAVNEAKLIANYAVGFDALRARDAARKRARLSSLPSPLSDVSVDDEDLVGIG